MSKIDCIPKKDGDFLTLQEFLSINAPTKQPDLNINGVDLVTLTQDFTLFKAKFDAFNIADAAYSAAATAKQKARAAVEGRTRAIIRRFKAAPGYTEAIGQALKIIGSDDTTDMTTETVDLTATVRAHGIELGYTKKKSDGVRIYTKRDGDTDWVFLTHETNSPYVDNRALLVPGKPETRRYKAIYVVDDQEIGNFSPEVVATAQP